MATQLIRLILHDGDPEGHRTASIAGRTTTVTAVPWVQQQALMRRADAARPGVYFLVGEPIEGDTEAIDQVAYVGECDSLVARFSTKHHQSDRAEWSQFFFATTTDGIFNKAHARLAEHLLVNIARDSGRVKLLNGGTSAGRLDDGDEAFAKDFVANVVILAQALGVMIFRQTSTNSSPSLGQTKTVLQAAETASSAIAAPPSSAAIFSFRINGAFARMKASGSEFVVLPGSTLVGQETGSIGDLPRRLRRLGLDNGSLVRTDDGALLRVERDIPTKSVSAAAQLVSGNSVNGMKAWVLDGIGLNFGQWTEELGQIRKEVLG